jgi:hypothetical protein
LREVDEARDKRCKDGVEAKWKRESLEKMKVRVKARITGEDEGGFLGKEMISLSSLSYAFIVTLVYVPTSEGGYTTIPADRPGGKWLPLMPLSHYANHEG